MFWQYVKEVDIIGIGVATSTSASKPARLENLPKQARSSPLSVQVSYAVMTTLRGDEQDLRDVCEVVVGGGASLVCWRRMDSRARSVMLTSGRAYSYR